MKILKISFSNINNLRGGPHEVAFNEAPLATAGIFAILGPTGSGKSTLLDVITLALFNRIPRFKKQISKNEILGLGSVMTHHANEASAAIIYSIDGKEYTSTWNVAKARTGKLKDYEMTLQDADGKYFDLKRSEVPAKNEAIIGLKYDQFIKSIILSQGQFSKFLKAEKSERGKLLENITGTGIYRQLGQLAYQKFKTVKASVELEQHKLGEILVFSEEEKQAINKEIEQHNKEKTLAEKEVKRLTAIKLVKVALKEIATQLIDKERDFSQLKINIQAFQPNLQKLELHEKLNPFRGDLTLFQQTKENKIQTAKNLKGYESALSVANENLKEVIAQMSTLTKEQISESNFKSVMSAFEKEVNKMDADLNYIKENGQELRVRINNKIAAYPTNFDAKIGAVAALEQLTKHEEQLNNAIQKSSITADTDLAESKANLKKQQALKENLVALNTLLTSHADLQDKMAEASKELLQLEKSKATSAPLIESAIENFQAIEKIGNLLMKQKEDALKIASLEQLRSDLQEDEPCPLCGSLSHPYTAHLPENELSAIDTQIQENQTALQQKQEALKTLKDKSIQVDTSIDLFNKNIVSLQKESTQVSEKINTAKKGLDPNIPLDLPSFSEHLGKLSSAISALEIAIGALETLKLNKILQQEFNELKTVLNNYHTLMKKRTEKFSDEDPSLICNKLQDQFNAAQTSQAENKKAQAIETKDLDRANKLLKKITLNLQPKVTQLGFSNLEAIESQILEESIFQNLKQQKESLLTSETKLKTELNSLKANQAKQLEQDKFPNDPLAEIALKLEAQEKLRNNLIDSIGALNSRLKEDAARSKRRKDKEKAINKLGDTLERWSSLNHIIGDATGNKFSNFAQGLTLQNLLVFTNKRLRNLSDRYLLNMPGDDGSFRVIDQYQGNTERAVSTLSGGETFLISLALALSLSDMASRNVPLDSLFIDEGFGTLDQETLDIAMTTLESLQTESQKTVGVISHVEALKERINVQIKMVKDAQGASRVEIEG